MEARIVPIFIQKHIDYLKQKSKSKLSKGSIWSSQKFGDSTYLYKRIQQSTKVLSFFGNEEGKCTLRMGLFPRVRSHEAIRQGQVPTCGRYNPTTEHQMG